MSKIKLTNLCVKNNIILPTPLSIHQKIPITSTHRNVILKSRLDIINILNKKDSRFLLFVGPCSIHNNQDAYEYAEKLVKLARDVNDRIVIVMRVYFSKPRTSLGWNGFIFDPDLDCSNNVIKGLTISRQLLYDIVNLGLPTATEFLDPIIPQYLSDLISWTAIGARTSESQIHRQMASGFPMPVGFKNSTDGNTQIAINAVKTSVMPQVFLGINYQGNASVIHTKGNLNSHIVLRGSKNGTNYHYKSIQNVGQQLKSIGLIPNIIVDCSHGNSSKNYKKQLIIFKKIINQIKIGNHYLVGAMLESNLNSGNQPFPCNNNILKKGISITDECIDWETTKSIIYEAYALI